LKTQQVWGSQSLQVPAAFNCWSTGFRANPQARQLRNILRISIIGIGLSMLPMSQLPAQWVIVAFFFTLGLAWGPLLPLLNTVIQTRIPANKRGRVFALEMTIWNAGPMVSMVAVGSAVDAFGVKGVYTALAIGVLAAAILVSTNKHMKELNT
jgi:MFS transporter, DHA3 family, macrolide efflux protein